MSESHLPFDAVSKIEELERRIWELERRRLPVIPQSSGQVSGGGLLALPFQAVSTVASATVATSMINGGAITIPAGALMNPGSWVHLRIGGDFQNNTGVARDWFMEVEIAGTALGTAVLAGNINAVPAAAGIYRWNLDFWAATFFDDLVSGAPEFDGFGWVLAANGSANAPAPVTTHSFPIIDSNFGPLEEEPLTLDVRTYFSASSASLRVLNLGFTSCTVFHARSDAET